MTANNSELIDPRIEPRWSPAGPMPWAEVAALEAMEVHADADGEVTAGRHTIADWIGVSSPSTARGLLEKLRRRGLLVRVAFHGPRGPSTYRVVSTVDDAIARFGEGDQWAPLGGSGRPVLSPGAAKAL